MAGSGARDEEIQSLIDLVSNTTEAYTAALFLAPAPGEPLYLAAYQSLSQNIDLDVQIGPGEGLVGWVYKNNKAVIVDQFDQDTRRLLFYRTDEAIKSFLAVPLSKAEGVLAVDSKRRYVFTDKTQKICHQFAQALDLALERRRQVERGRRREEAQEFLAGLEQVLSPRDQSGQYLRRAMAEVRAYVGAEACFLAAVLPAERGRYVLMAHDTHRSYRLSKEALRVDRGLAGWVMKEKKPLFLERARLDSDRSYIFYPEEPFGDFVAFAGLPLVWGRRLLGALCLGGEDSFDVDEIKAQTLETAADRLAATLESEFLFQRVTELGLIDPQTGLPHRTDFTRRLKEFFSRPAAREEGVDLIVLRLANLEAVAVQRGQDTAQAVLKAAARHLLSKTPEEAELGHLGYGLFGVAVPSGEKTAAEPLARALAEAVEKEALKAARGGLSLKVQTSTVQYPAESQRAEELIYLGLAGLRNR